MGGGASALFGTDMPQLHLHTGLWAIATEPGRRNTVTEELANHHPLHDGNMVFINDTYQYPISHM